MARPTGPFHSLTPTDKTTLRRLLREGLTLRAATTHTGCNYRHAWHFAHAHELIDYRPRTHPEGQTEQFLDLIRTGHSVHAAATTTGIGSTRATRLATEAGLHLPRTQHQRKVAATELRIDYLRLRLASLPRAHAATTVDIDRRLALDIDKGLVKNTGPRQRFLPAGPDATTYNRLMTAWLTRTDIIEQGRLAEPALPPGLNPYTPISSRYLSMDERIQIADLYREHLPLREIARRLGRAASTISREIRRNHSAEGPYRPDTAQKKATVRRLRPKIPKLLGNKALYDYVVAGLRAEWSPEQITGRLPVDHPDDQDMRISPETIYQAFYLDTKGRLKDLGLQLPTGRKKRRLRHRPRTAGPGRFVDAMVMIDDRPDDVEERILPGHWEGDLILGAGNQSAVITLVERVSRFVALGHLPTDHTSTSVLTALTGMIGRLDESIWSSITWDQGSEMAGHKAFTMGTDIPVYFCHPGSPWERGTNENTNGRLRRNLPKSSDLSIYSAEDLEMIADIHNHKPRKALDWATPAEIMAQALQETGSIA